MVEPAPSLSTFENGGEAVSVAKAVLLHGTDWVSLVGYRDHASTVSALEVGHIYYIHAGLVREKELQGTSSVEVRMGRSTEIMDCPEPLRTEIEGKTAATTDGAVGWSVSLKAARNYEEETAEWQSLSAVAAISAPETRRQLPTVYDVPSVLLKLASQGITYRGCANCSKSWKESEEGDERNKPCFCAGSTPKVFWKAQVSLMDSTASITASAFDGISALAHWFADHQSNIELAEPSHYAANLVDIDLLMQAVMAVPWTVRLSIDDSDYDEAMVVMIRAMAPTFDRADGVKHPLAGLPRFPSNSYPCPPCVLTDVQFEASAGITKVPGGGALVFRALLEVVDNPTGARQDPNTTVLRVSRRCVCALRGSEDATVWTLVQNGPLEVSSRLLQVRKNEYVHTVVSCRAAGQLTLNAFHALGNDDVTSFQAFFSKERALYVEKNGASQIAFVGDDATTPLRIAKAASALAPAIPPQQWRERAAVQK